MKTWSEVLAQRGINVDALRRGRRLQDEGCAIRVLQSITGQKATPEEVDRRLRQIDRQPDLLDTLIEQRISNPKLNQD